MSDFANWMNIIEVIDILVRGFRIAMILFSPLKLGLVKSCEVLNFIGTFFHQYDAPDHHGGGPRANRNNVAAFGGLHLDHRFKVVVCLSSKNWFIVGLWLFRCHFDKMSWTSV